MSDIEVGEELPQGTHLVFSADVQRLSLMISEPGPDGTPESMVNGFTLAVQAYEIGTDGTGESNLTMFIPLDIFTAVINTAAAQIADED